MGGVATSSRADAHDDLGLRPGVVILASHRRPSRSEHVAEVVLSAVTMLLGSFLLACVRHALQLSSVQFMP